MDKIFGYQVPFLRSLAIWRQKFLRILFCENLKGISEFADWPQELFVKSTSSEGVWRCNAPACYEVLSSSQGVDVVC